MINFSIMLITFKGNEYLLDLTKMPSYQDKIMEMIMFLIYEIQDTDLKNQIKLISKMNLIQKL